jgi:hypothetical protein
LGSRSACPTFIASETIFEIASRNQSLREVVVPGAESNRPRIEQHCYPETTGILPQVERYWHPVPGCERAQGSCPAGLLAVMGLRWCGATPQETERRIPMSKPATKLAPKSAAQRVTTAKLAQPPAADPRKKTDKGSKQARIITMLRSPTGTTVAAMMTDRRGQRRKIPSHLGIRVTLMNGTG